MSICHDLKIKAILKIVYMVLFVRTMHTSHLVPVIRRSAKMFWVLLTLSLALADKLDRAYLPPPGSKFSGGSPGVIQVPLQYPKLASSIKENNSPRPEIAIGIDRVAPNLISNSFGVNIPSAYLDKFNTLPTTVFPQTTTQSSQNHFDGGSPNFPVNDFGDTKVYPKQIQGGNILNNPISYANQDYSSTSMPVKIDPLTGTLDSLIGNVFECNNSTRSDILPKQYNPCTYKENQYYSTVAPSSINPNFPDGFSSNGIRNFIQFSTTTQSPLNKISYGYNNDNKRPERIQAQADREAVILNYDNSLTPDSYAYSFDTSNGIHGDESGITLDGVKAKGSYSYVGDDGKLYKVVYTADENGFQPQGDHLPTAPPIPEAILKVIEKAYEDKKAGVIDDGSYDDNKYGYKKYQKRPYGQINGKLTENSDKLNQNSNIGLYPNQVNQYTEKVFKNNVSGYPSMDRVFSENYDPKIMNQYYNSENLPQSVRDGFKGILDTDDLETGDDVINNEKNPNGIYSTTPSDVVKIKEQHGEEGYQYYRPQITGVNKFPNRFTEIQNKQQYSKKKVTPKPFLTPYVSRNNDDGTQTYGSAEEPGSEIFDTRYYNASIDPDQKGSVEERYNYNNPSTDKGYIYPEAETNKRPFNPFTGSKSSHFSTNVPTEFPSRLSSTLPSNQYNSGVPQTSKFRYTPESVTENQNSLPPNYSTAQPGFTNEYKTTLPSNYNTYGGLPGKGLNPTSIPDFKPSFAPNIDTTQPTQPDSFTTEKGIGEDFSGPKQPQSFDPITGYHY